MVQQLYSDIGRIKSEIRRLRGELRRIVAGGTVIGSGGGSSTIPTPTSGSMIRGNASPGWERLDLVIPSSGLRNVVGVDNAESQPSWKALLDTTDPVTQNFDDVPAPGTSLIAARRDHVHGMPSAGSPGAHDHTSGDGGVLTNDEHDGYSEYTEIVTPSTPAANKVRLYAKDDGGDSKLFYVGDDGVEVGPLGAGGGGGAAMYLAMDHRSPDNTDTQSINSTSYIAPSGFRFVFDHTVAPATHFRITARSASNAAATVTGQLALFASPGTPLSSGGDDIVFATSTSLANADSGWLAFATPPTTDTIYVLAVKGSSATVDWQPTSVQIHFKYAP